MIKAERHDLIMAEVAKRGAAGVRDLAEQLGVSQATVRRDISELDARSLVLRTHGGAAVCERRREVPYDAKVMAYLPEKRRIGAHAASMLRPSMTIGCGGGTTVMQMIRSIKAMPLYVLTTAVNVAYELRASENIDVFLTGGMMRRQTAELVGHVCEQTIGDFNLDVAVIGADGVDAEFGVTTFDSEEAYINRVLTNRAREVWILADHSKLGSVCPAVISPVRSSMVLITDDGAPGALVSGLRVRGAKVVLV